MNLQDQERFKIRMRWIYLSKFIDIDISKFVLFFGFMCACVCLRWTGDLCKVDSGLSGSPSQDCKVKANLDLL